MRMFSLVHSGASELSHLPTTWWCLVGIMMWLTWWCGWYDGETLTMTLACNSEVSNQIFFDQAQLTPWPAHVRTWDMSKIPKTSWKYKSEDHALTFHLSRLPPNACRTLQWACFVLRITRNQGSGSVLNKLRWAPDGKHQSPRNPCGCNSCLEAPYAKSICDALKSSPANYLTHSDRNRTRRNQNFKQTCSHVGCVWCIWCWDLGNVTQVQCSEAGAIFDLADCNPKAQKR